MNGFFVPDVSLVAEMTPEERLENASELLLTAIKRKLIRQNSLSKNVSSSEEAKNYESQTLENKENEFNSKEDLQ